MPINYLQGMAGRFGRGANTLGTMEDPRARFAQQLQAEGADTSPAFLGTGLSRLGKALVGALLMKRSMADQSDATKWLTSKMPDRTRPPTEAEAFEASPELDVLRQQQLVTPVFEAKLAPDPDDVLMGKTEVDEFGDPTGIPQTLEKLNILNYLQEQHKDFPEQTEFTNPYTGRTDTATAEDFAKLPGLIDEGSRKFAEQMEQARQATMRPRPVDYAQELATGMEAYRADPTHQISDPYTRSEWLRESYRNDPELKNNWFANRILQNMTLADIQRDISQEDITSKRGFTTSEREASQKFKAGESKKDRTSRERAAKLRAVGEDPNAWKLWLKADKLSDEKFEKFLLTRRGYNPRDIGGTLYTPKLSKPDEGVGEEKKITLGPEQEEGYIKKVEEIKQEAKLGAARMDDLIRMRPKAFSSLGAFKQKTNFMKDNIAQALNNISGWSTEFGSALSGWPGSQAQALKTILNTIKANVGFQALQEMRANSPTGGALGQVSERELAYLQATLGDIAQEQDGAILAEKLRAMQRQIEGMHGRLQQAYDMTFRPLTEAEGGDGNQYTTRAPVPFSPAPQNSNTGNKFEGWKVD